MINRYYFNFVYNSVLKRALKNFKTCFLLLKKLHKIINILLIKFMAAILS